MSRTQGLRVEVFWLSAIEKVGVKGCRIWELRYLTLRVLKAYGLQVQCLRD